MVDDDELELVRVVALVELVGQPELITSPDGFEPIEADPFGPLESAADRGAVGFGVESVFFAVEGIDQGAGRLGGIDEPG